MKSLFLSAVLVLGSLGLQTQNAKADDSVLDGTFLGAFGGAVIAAVTKGDLGVGAVIGGAIGLASDAAYDDDITERKVVRYINGRPVYEVYTSTRDGGKVYDGPRRYRTTTITTTTTRVVRDSTRTPGAL